MITKLTKWWVRDTKATVTQTPPTYVTETDGFISTSSATYNNPRYALTDDGLQALVDGKLSCEKIIHEDPTTRPGSFYVQYDSIVYDPTNSRVQLVWKGVTIMEVQVPSVSYGNTLTISGLIGKVPLEIST